MTEAHREAALRQALVAVLGEAVSDAAHLKLAARIMADRHKASHRLMHAQAQQAGAFYWGLRQRGLSWREIYDATGMVQRTAQRHIDLFLTEGITPQPADELDTRAFGKDHND